METVNKETLKKLLKENLTVEIERDTTDQRDFETGHIYMRRELGLDCLRIKVLFEDEVIASTTLVTEELIW